MAPSPMAEAGCNGRRRFAVACSVLSHCVRAETAAAHARPVVQPQAAASPMLLMPGADVVASEEAAPTTASASASAQLTIVYGSRVLAFDHVRAGTAAEVMRVAAAARRDMPPGGLADLQVARKASLQRVMEKRRDRHRTRAPYAPAHAPAAELSSEQREKDAEIWLKLGIPG